MLEPHNRPQGSHSGGIPWIMYGPLQARFKRMKLEPNCHRALVIHSIQDTRVSGNRVLVTNEIRCLPPGLQMPHE